MITHYTEHWINYTKSGLAINASKCEFSKSKIEFFGHIFSENGISPDPGKVRALKDAAQPQNKSKVRSFLGMAQYSSRFIPDFATITEPLRRLTKKDEQWCWNDTEETAFQNIKHFRFRLTSNLSRI